MEIKNMVGRYVCSVERPVTLEPEIRVFFGYDQKGKIQYKSPINAAQITLAVMGHFDLQGAVASAIVRGVSLADRQEAWVAGQEIAGKSNRIC